MGSALSSPQQQKTTFAATRHVSWALNKPKMRLRPGWIANAFLVYLESRERVSWLQMSSCLCNRIEKVSKCGSFWMHCTCMLPCSRLLNST